MEGAAVNYRMIFSWKANTLAGAVPDVEKLADMIEGSWVEDVIIEPHTTGTSSVTLDLSDTDIPSSDGRIYAGQLLINEATIIPELWPYSSSDVSARTDLGQPKYQIESIEYEDEGFTIGFVDNDAPTLTVLPTSLQLRVVVDESENIDADD
ncbi:MAG: hypothetical protein M3R24_13195 [Chloroflexota bacterium]|nr:hypothetical protein [Chloroflexota bacterium]